MLIKDAHDLCQLRQGAMSHRKTCVPPSVFVRPTVLHN